MIDFAKNTGLKVLQEEDECITSGGATVSATVETDGFAAGACHLCRMSQNRSG